MNSKLTSLTTDCYKNLEKAGVLVDVLYENYLHEKNTVVILDMLSENIKHLTEIILEIQEKIR